METIKKIPDLPPTHMTDVGEMSVFSPESFIHDIEAGQPKQPDVIAREAIGHTATQAQTEVIPSDKSDT